MLGESGNLACKTTEDENDQARLPASELLPEPLRVLLADLQAELGGSLYLSGGAVRDALLGRKAGDIDLALASDATKWARRLAACTGSACISLGREEETVRVAGGDLVVDFAVFRQGARNIEEELRLRDLRINAMAVCLNPLLQRVPCQDMTLPVIDPTGGMEDLKHKNIQSTSEAAFRMDPLRMLRAFRFAAELDYTISPHTLAQIRDLAPLIVHSATERQSHELDLIMHTPRAHATFKAMAENELLWFLLPELVPGRGMAQPKSHHLDVWGHSLDTLRAMEQVIADPATAFPGEQSIIAFLAGKGHTRLLKWTALLHDMGKPATFGRHPEQAEKITFYNHDQIGAEYFCSLATRLHWSIRDMDFVAQLIRMHMQPFHLANVLRENKKISLRAQIRLLRRAGALLPGLFLLAMADSLAGQGEERMPIMEAELARLYHQLEEVRLSRVEPIRKAHPLLNGHDLIRELGLTPGPLFKKILLEVEEARMEGQCNTREDALALAQQITATEQNDHIARNP